MASLTDSLDWRWLQNTFNDSLVLPLNYTNWGLNEPILDAKAAHDSMAFVSKTFSNFSPGDWFSRSSENEEYFVCEYRCEENTTPNKTKTLIFSSGDEWLIPDSNYMYSFIGEVNIPENFEVSLEVKLLTLTSPNNFYPITFGSYEQGIIYYELLPTLPRIYLDYKQMLIYLSGANDTRDCYIRLEFENYLFDNEVYEISLNFLTTKIEIFFDNLLLSTCQNPSPDYFENVFSCKQAKSGSGGEEVYDNVSNFEFHFYQGAPGFQYKAKPRDRMPIWAGVNYPNYDDYSHPMNYGRVRNIDIYALTDYE